MHGIHLKNDNVLFYGNKAGYLENGIAIIDPIFECEEIKTFLEENDITDIQWTDGTYELLANSKPDVNGRVPTPKICRIHQLKPEVDVSMKFIGYDEMLVRFGAPNPDDYQVVYDGHFETNDLDAIYEKFNIDHPADFEGHSLLISDVIELYDSTGSSFHYIDRFGFKKIPFQTPGPELQNGTLMLMQ